MAFTFVFLILLYSLFTLPGHILTAIGLYSIARRRGIEFPWTAWLPGVNFWLVGCISDQYQAIVRGKQRNRRTLLLCLILIPLVAFCAMHLAVPAGGQAAGNALFLLIFVPAWCAAAVLVVVFFMALYDLYVSCDPKNAVLYLVLSIVLGVTQPVFLFLCRKKDLGFPL